MNWHMLVPLVLFFSSALLLGWHWGRKCGYTEGRLHERLITLAFIRVVKARLEDGGSLAVAVEEASKRCLDDDTCVVDG